MDDSNADNVVEGHELERDWVDGDSNDNSSQKDTVDSRKFSREAYSMLSTSFSVDKTLQKAFRTKTVHPPTIYSNLSVDNSVLGSMNSSFLDSVPRRKHHNASDLETFRIHIWESFCNYAVKPISESEPFDMCSASLCVDNLVSALYAIVDYYSKQEIEQMLQKMHFLRNSMICWKEFIDLVYEIYQPYISSIETEKDRNNKSLVHSSSVHDPAHYPFQRLLEKQRFVSTFSTRNKKMNEENVISSTSMQLDDNIASSNQVSQEILASMKSCPHKNSRILGDDSKDNNDRKLSDTSLFNDSIASGKGSDDANGKNTNAFDSNSTGFPKYSVSTIPQVIPGHIMTGKEKKFMLPLESSKINQLLDPSVAYPERWKAMKMKRDERKDIIKKNMARNEMLTTLKRIIHMDEKETVANVCSIQKYARQYEKTMNYQQKKYDEEDRNERVVQWKVNNQQRKANSAKQFNQMIKRANEQAKRVQQEELQEKSLCRESSISRMDSMSSTQVKIPEALEAKVKTAKRASEYQQAQKNIKDYYEKTLSNRINTYTRSRSEAMIKALSGPNAAVSVTEIQGSQYFQEPNLSRATSLLLPKLPTRGGALENSTDAQKTTMPQFRHLPRMPSPGSINDSDISDMVLSEYKERCFMNDLQFDLDSLWSETEESLASQKDAEP